MRRKSCDPVRARARAGKPGCDGGGPDLAEARNECRWAEPQATGKGPPGAGRRDRHADDLVSSVDGATSENGSQPPFSISRRQSCALGVGGGGLSQRARGLADVDWIRTDHRGNRPRRIQQELGEETRETGQSTLERAPSTFPRE